MRIRSLSALIIGAALAASVIQPAAAAEPEPASSSPVYRFWSPQNQTHFYTMSVTERDSIRANYPASIWTYEGERYRAFSTQEPGTVPLYRFWSPRLSGHFFTTNEAEKDAVIRDYDDWTWTYERIAYYVYPKESTVANTVPVARFWSPQNQHHFYTASAQETVVVKTYPAHIWTYEGDNFRVPAPPDPLTFSLTTSCSGSPEGKININNPNNYEISVDFEVDSDGNGVFDYGGDYLVPANAVGFFIPLTIAEDTHGSVRTLVRDVVRFQGSYSLDCLPPPNPGNSVDCPDFATWHEAQAWYLRYYPYYGDVAGLDRDNDGIVCESLPGHP